MYSQIASNKRKTWLLMILFFIAVLALGWFLGEFTDTGYSGLAIASIIAIVMSLTSYYAGDKIALWTARARGPITREENPYVYRLVENLAITAGVPMPKVYLIPDPALNAFATGRDYEHASIALTSGIVEALANEELEGVIAHELSHIKNYDMRLMTIVVVLVGVIALLSDMFWRWHWFGGSRKSERNQLGALIMLIGLVLVILAPLAAQLIKFAISRKREFLADASGALLTRYPEGLARALEKIAAGPALARTSTATAHLYIANPFAVHGASLMNLFSTHPPIEKRLKALRAMA